MKRRDFFKTVAGLFVPAAPAIVRAQTLPFPGPGMPASAGGGGGYTLGPGDVVSGARLWYGLRGYNAAYATGSNNAIDVVDQAGSNPLSVKILSTGALDVASVSTWVTANSVTTIKITKLYDQTGNGNHVTQATLASMPVLTLSALGSLPCITFTRASQHRLGGSTGITSASQPYSLSFVSNGTNPGGICPIISVGTSTLESGHGFVGANSVFLLDATGSNVIGAPATENAVHATQILVSGPSSSLLMVDGTDSATQATDTSATSTGSPFIGCDNGNNNFFGGQLFEVGLWPSGFSGTNRSDLNTKQHSYWGF